MKKSLIFLGSVLLILPLSSFKSVSNQKIISVHQKQLQTWDAGYFTVGSQMYHAYADQQEGTIVALYRSPGEGNPDGIAITTFSGYSYTAPPPSYSASVNVTFTDGTSKHYKGPVTY
ncbi:hypothetical protein EWM62_13890 [Mucilaginibacter terrigena]|uniref:Uncharacterized protein n=1 Tax=Mucilaginibacter terrigena TaxID=2492395 RepID=A0A4Q5LJE1_9SPHI|nr:hypothetical protein [Mucilaginibacter terrigena]RYU89414.1 hypothetical protein EWM62_13890 [Mucilaginibacter terrigena]